MHNRRQDYLSSVFKNIGLAMFTPFGSLIFQWIVFRKDMTNGHIYFSIFVLLLGLLFLAIGYTIIKNDRR